MTHYIVADSANSDIDEILTNILPCDEQAAWGWYSELHNKFATLAHSPEIGRIRDDLLPDLYMFPYGNYLIFYDITSDGIVIVHITHSKRDVARTYEK